MVCDVMRMFQINLQYFFIAIHPAAEFVPTQQFPYLSRRQIEVSLGKRAIQHVSCDKQITVTVYIKTDS